MKIKRLKTNDPHTLEKLREEILEITELSYGECVGEESGDASLASPNGSVRMPRVNEGYEASTELKGWWSNQAVVESMDDHRLRDLLESSREMVRLCEHEMLRRSVLGHAKRGRSIVDRVSYGPYQKIYGRREREREPRPKSAKRRTPKAGQLQLSPDDLLKALQLLMSKKGQDGSK